MRIDLDEVVHFDVITSSATTGAAADADSTPTFSVYEEDTDTAIVGPTNMTKRTSLTGNYRGSFTASTANGFEVGKWYSVIASATVGSVAGKCVAKNFYLKAVNDPVNVVEISGDATAADNAEAMFDGTGYAGGTIKLGVDTVAISGSATAADNAEIVYDTDFGTNYNTTSDKWAVLASVDIPDLLQETTIATLSTQTEFTLTAGSADDDAYNNHLAVIIDQSTSVQKAAVQVSDYVGSTKTVTLAATPVFTIATGDTIKIVAAPPATVSGTVNANVTQWSGTSVATPDTAGYPKVTIKTGTGTGELSVTSGVVSANATQISGSSTAADNVEVVFATDFGTAYDTTNDRWKVDAVAISGSATAADNAEVVYATDFATNYSTSTDKWQVETSATGVRSGTAQAGAAGAITLDSGASATNDLYNGLMIQTTGGTGAGQVRWIYDYAGSTKVASITPDWTTTPDNTTTFAVLPHYLPGWVDSADADDKTGSVYKLLAEKLAYITSETILQTDGLVSDGDVMTVYRGEIKSVSLAVPAATVDLTGFTPRLGITKLTSNSGTSTLEVSGTVNDAGLSSQSVTFSWTAVQTAALALSSTVTHGLRIDPASAYAYRFTISAFYSTTACPTLAQGYVDVKARDTTCS